MEKKRNIRRMLAWGSALLATAVLAAIPMLVRQNGEENRASILSAPAEARTIQRTLVAGGSITPESQTDLTVPYGVRITQLLASNGDSVQAGDPIAAVDRVSVMTAAVKVQASLKAIASDLQKAKNKVSSGAITVDTVGTVYVDGKEIDSSKLSDYGNYLRLAQQHREYEQILADLFALYSRGAVAARESGLVDGLNRAVVQKTGAGEENLTAQLLAFHVPGEDGESYDDELDYQGYVAIIGSITEEGEWDLLRTPYPVPFEDFAAPGADTSLTSMTVAERYPAMEVLVYTEEGWTATRAAPGDILLLVEGIWAIKLGRFGSTSDGRGEEEIDLEEMMAAMSGRGGSSGQSQKTELYSTEKIYVCTLVSQNDPTLTVQVDEQDIALVQLGMTARVTLDAWKDRELTGTVTRISKFGTGNGGSSKFAVELTLPYDAGMLPGMNACAEIILGRTEAALAIPVAALVEQGNKCLVYTAYDAKTDQLLQPVEVILGTSDGSYVEILSGLARNQPVWYSYYDKLVISTEA